MGKKASESCQIFVDETGIPMTPEAFRTEREEGLAKLFPTCDLMPGAERLVRHLKASGVLIAVATSSNRDSFDLKVTTKHKVIQIFRSHRNIYVNFIPGVFQAL